MNMNTNSLVKIKVRVLYGAWKLNISQKREEKKWNYLIFVYFIFFSVPFFSSWYNTIIFPYLWSFVPTQVFFCSSCIDNFVNCWSHCSLFYCWAAFRNVFYYGRVWIQVWGGDPSFLRTCKTLKTKLWSNMTIWEHELYL